MNVKICRVCHSRSLVRYLDLGFTPPADAFLRAQSLHQPETHYPLDVFLCQDCGLSQVGYIVPPEILYQHDYPYESSTTASGRQHFFGLATSVASRFKLNGEDMAVDVGSNVGVLLEGFQKQGLKILGVEPAANIAALAVARNIETIDDFFSPSLAARIVNTRGHARVITATNVFAHVDDLDAFIEAVDTLLADNGIFIIEAPHFLKLLQNLEYDTIYHEHLSYLAVKPLTILFRRFGYEVFDVEQIGIHGGSIRVYVAKSGRFPVSDTPGKMIEMETAERIFDLDRLRKFARDVAAHRWQLTDFLRRLKNQGKTIAGVSAPAKGMTLLNYSMIGTQYLDFVTEKTRLKIGRYTPGMHIPVLPDSALLEQKPDYALLLAWNFAAEIIENLSAYRKAGGKFIIPIPEPRVVED